MSHVSRTITTDRVFTNPALMHNAERLALVHQRNLNLNEEDFEDVDDDLAELEVMDEEEFFTHYVNAINLDSSFD